MRKKVLFFGSDPEQGNGADIGLDIDREAEIVKAVYERTFFEFTPHYRVSFSQFEDIVAVQKPSIIHISAHGDGKVIRFVPAAEKNEITFEAEATHLHQVFSTSNNLELVYLDACNSALIATRLASFPDCNYFIVGFDGDIGVIPSTRGAGIFHTHVANGRSVEVATQKAERFLERAFNNGVYPRLALPMSPGNKVIRPSAEVLARFYKDDARADKKGRYTVNFGIRLNGDHLPTMKDYVVCFFSGEKRFVDREYVTLLKGRLPHDQFFWHDDPALECWDFSWNAPINCTYGIPSEQMDTVHSTVTEALLAARKYGLADEISNDEFESSVNALVRGAADD